MEIEVQAEPEKAVASQVQLENDLSFLLERVEHLALKLRRIDLENHASMRAALEKLRFDADSISQGLGDLRRHLGAKTVGP
jgi:hypothetical protein